MVAVSGKVVVVTENRLMKSNCSQRIITRYKLVLWWVFRFQNESSFFLFEKTPTNQKLHIINQKIYIAL